MNRKVFKRRVIITGILIISIACFFIYRFTHLLLTEKIKLSAGQSAEIRRGYIKDRHGFILAISVERKSLFANPQEIDNPAEISSRLSPVLGCSKNFILRRLSKDKQFVWLKRKMDDDDAVLVEKMGIKGLYFKKEFKRLYPHDRLASNILGFVDVDNNGLEGIEYKYDSVLKGTDKKSIFQDLLYDSSKDLVEGKNISLTIDRTIQDFSEEQIERAVKQYSAKQGVVTIMEVDTGRVLAIAKYPDFNPNYYYRFSGSERGNFTVVNSYEPGSTFKVIALAAVLEYFPGAINKGFTCPGYIEIGDATIKCGKAHGSVSINDIIKYSCNVGIIKAMKGVSKNEFFNIIKDFGFGKDTGIELPGESRGILRGTDRWSGLSKYSISIGQEISVTSIQLAAAFSAIGNGGVYLKPRIIESIERPDETISYAFHPEPDRRVIKTENARRILGMMREVVIGGTGEKADIGYYKTAGKTGTAQKSMRRGGYSPDKFVASFIGLAPVEKPDICILVVIDEPGGVSAGGEVAAPVFARIAGRILPYRGVKLNTIGEIEPIQKNRDEIEYNGRQVPDFRGLSMADSLRLLIKMQKYHNFSYYFTGSGHVYEQSVAAGTDIKNFKEIILYLRER